MKINHFKQGQLPTIQLYPKFITFRDESLSLSFISYPRDLYDPGDYNLIQVSNWHSVISRIVLISFVFNDHFRKYDLTRHLDYSFE